MLQAHVECHVLQFTIAVTRTACAVLIVIGEDPSNLPALHFANAFGASLHSHTVGERCRAGCHDLTAAAVIGDFHKADAARSGRVVQRQIGAQRWNKNTQTLGGMQNGFAFLEFKFFVVDPGFHFFVPLPF